MTEMSWEVHHQILGFVLAVRCKKCRRVFYGWGLYRALSRFFDASVCEQGEAS